MTWHTTGGYCWDRALRMLGERSLATFSGVVLAAIALAVPGFCFMLAQAGGLGIGRLPVAEISVFVAPGTGSADLKALAGRIETLDGVAHTHVLARDQAWADLQRRAGQATSDIRSNPLPDVVAVEFVPQATPSAVEAAAATIGKLPRVDTVQTDLEWYRRLVGLVKATAAVLASSGTLVGLLVFVVVIGLVRVLATVEPAELRLLDQIGAERDFMRRPFVYAGGLLTGMAAAGALGLLAAAQVAVNPPLAELGRLLGIELQLHFPPWPLILAFVAACLLVGAGAGAVLGERQMAAAKVQDT